MAPPALAPKIAKEFVAPAALVCCAFDAAGTHAWAGGEDGKAHRWRIADGVKPTSFAGHESWVFALAAAGEFVVSAGGDGKLCWWPAAGEAPKPIRTVEAHDGWARCLAASPDGKLLASGGNDFRVRVWSNDGKPVRTLAGHGSRVYSVLFHPDGQRLYSGDLRGQVREWNLADGKELGVIHAKELYHENRGQDAEFGGIRGMAVSPDRKLLALCGVHRAPNPFGGVYEPLALSFSAETRQPAKQHMTAGLIGSAWRCAYLPDGTLLTCSGGNGGGALLFFKPGEDKEFRRFMLPNGARYLALAPDGKSVLTAHHDRKLRLTALHAA